MKRDPSLIPLSHQHQHGLALSVRIDRALKAGDDLAGFREDVARIWDVELRGHFQVEEELLFDPARRRLPDPKLVDRLIGQHRELERLIEAVRKSSEAGLEPALRSFGETLSRHIRIEERELFEQMQEAFSAAELADLGRSVEGALVKACPGLENPS